MTASKGQRKSSNPDAPDAAQTEEFLREVVDFLRLFGNHGLDALRKTIEALKAPRTIEARRELVLTLVLAQTPTYKIKACVMATHGANSRTIDEDIKLAKEWHADKVSDRRRQEIKEEVDGIYQAIISRGLTTGNLSAARASNDGRARLHHLVEEIPTGGPNNGDSDEDFRVALDRKLSRLASEGTKG